MCKIFLSSSSITKQNLVVVCHTVWADIGVPKILMLEAHSLQLGTVTDPAETRHSLSHTYYHTEFGGSRSNRMM